MQPERVSLDHYQYKDQGASPICTLHDVRIQEEAPLHDIRMRKEVVRLLADARSDDDEMCHHGERIDRGK